MADKQIYKTVLELSPMAFWGSLLFCLLNVGIVCLVTRKMLGMEEEV